MHCIILAHATKFAEGELLPGRGAVWARAGGKSGFNGHRRVLCCDVDIQREAWLHLARNLPLPC
ncbi:hypothetical protein E0H61_35665 [Rhizobium leguminosarum bv. viciae]|nr:hypothetical protein E0H61_35665 [Rhizobium leguminosarum bv. viciae]